MLNNNNITEIYGPHIWWSLHLLADNAPTILDSATKQAWLDNIKSYKNILPRNCTCAANFRNNLDLILDESRINTKQDLQNLINNLYNAVNKSLNKKVYSPQESKEAIDKVWRGECIFLFLDIRRIVKFLCFAFAIMFIIIFIKYNGVNIVATSIDKLRGAAIQT